MKISNEIAFYAKTGGKLMTNFGSLLSSAIDKGKLKKKDVAGSAGIHPTTLSRILSGAIGVSRETAIALVLAVNNLRGQELINEDEALNALGFSFEAVLPAFLYKKNWQILTPHDEYVIERFIDFLIVEKFENQALLRLQPGELRATVQKAEQNKKASKN
jgi:plasmid maintenance system antidote protein VapI